MEISKEEKQSLLVALVVFDMRFDKFRNYLEDGETDDDGGSDLEFLPESRHLERYWTEFLDSILEVSSQLRAISGRHDSQRLDRWGKSTDADH